MFGPGGVFRGSTGTSTDPHPVGSLGQMLNQVTAAIPAVAAAGSGGGSGSGNQNAPVVALPGSLATHKANIAQMRTSMWLYLTPLLGMLYILSPLDIIPDFLPLVGWIDDGECFGVLAGLWRVFWRVFLGGHRCAQHRPLARHDVTPKGTQAHAVEQMVTAQGRPQQLCTYM